VWIRVLQHYSTQQGVGVLIIMIIEMLKDMKLWMVLSSIFLVAFAISFLSIAEHAESPLEALAAPVWAMYGELALEEVTETSGLFGEVTLWIYALISNVLLVNLLIAMMGDTYARVKDAADIEWKFGRVNSVLEAIERTYPIPPPFSLPLLAFRFVWWAVCRLCFCCQPVRGRGCGPFASRRGFSKADYAAGLVDADGDGDPDEDPDWQVGGRLWTLKRERERVAKVALQNYRRDQEEKMDASSDGRLRRVEKLVEEILIFGEENERMVSEVLESVGDKRRGDSNAGSRPLTGRHAVCERSPYHPTETEAAAPQDV